MAYLLGVKSMNSDGIELKIMALIAGFAISAITWLAVKGECYAADLKRLVTTAFFTAGYIGPFGSTVSWLVIISGQWNDVLRALWSIAIFFVLYVVWYFPCKLTRDYLCQRPVKLADICRSARRVR